MKKPDEIIEQLKLQKHAEGGWYARTYTSPFSLEDNAFSSAIYYLLEGKDFSAFHRLKSDEMWHFYAGSPLHIYAISPDGVLTTHLLGNTLLNDKATFQILIPAGHWFAAEVADDFSFTLVGCTVTPGFKYADFELANREKLLQHYPNYAHLINRLTRV